jgi:antitoxin component YwqK of YwqJK toxin-antitoxin module
MIKRTHIFMLLAFSSILIALPAYSVEPPISVQIRLACEARASGCEKFIDNKKGADFFVQKQAQFSLDDINYAHFENEAGELSPVSAKSVSELSQKKSGPTVKLLLVLSDTAAKKFEKLSLDSFGKKAGIIVDGKLLAAIKIGEPKDGQIAVPGVAKPEAERIARLINGAHPDRVFVFKDRSNGGIRSESLMKNGKKEGPRKAYWQNGKLYFEGSYKDDRFDGVQKKYYENGKLLYEMVFKNGKMDGLCKIYDDAGKLVQQDMYKDGQLLDSQGNLFNGKRKFYLGLGRWMETDFKDGIQDGVSKVIDEDGIIETEKRYIDGEVVASRSILDGEETLGSWTPAK